MASKIGRKGRNPGPGRTNFVGSGRSGNLGSRTSMRAGAGMNRDASAAFKRRGINAGPGGEQRTTGFTGLTHI